VDRPPHVRTSGYLARDPPDRGVAQRLVRVRVRVRASVRIRVRVRVRVGFGVSPSAAASSKRM